MINANAIGSWSSGSSSVTWQNCTTNTPQFIYNPTIKTAILQLDVTIGASPTISSGWVTLGTIPFSFASGYTIKAYAILYGVAYTGANGGEVGCKSIFRVRNDSTNNVILIDAYVGNSPTTETFLSQRLTGMILIPLTVTTT